MSIRKKKVAKLKALMAEYREVYHINVCRIIQDDAIRPY